MGSLLNVLKIGLYHALWPHPVRLLVQRIQRLVRHIRILAVLNDDLPHASISSHNNSKY